MRKCLVSKSCIGVSRNHVVKGLEVMILLLVYQIYGAAATDSTYMLLTFSMWFPVVSWLFTPFLFNPSGFDWQKIVEDSVDWIKWYWCASKQELGVLVGRGISVLAIHWVLRRLFLCCIYLSTSMELCIIYMWPMEIKA